MIDRAVLLDRLYESVLAMTGIPSSQLAMLLENPDPFKHSEILRSLILDKMLADGWDVVISEAIGLAVPR